MVETAYNWEKPAGGVSGRNILLCISLVMAEM